jgi:hypothetical protein
MSGVILGPPNYHDYQNQLRKLHAERFARMPFEVFKSRVKIVRDEAVVKQWVEEQSWKTDYVCLNVPEPLKLASRSEVEQHFRATHKETIIKPVETQTITGVAARGIRSPELSRLVRFVTEDQRRFPLQIATVLSQQFASRGLQFFKKDKTVTHVSVARPSYLDRETTPVSDGIRPYRFHQRHHYAHGASLWKPWPLSDRHSRCPSHSAPEGAPAEVLPNPFRRPHSGADGRDLDLHWLSTKDTLNSLTASWKRQETISHARPNLRRRKPGVETAALSSPQQGEPWQLSSLRSRFPAALTLPFRPARRPAKQFHSSQTQRLSLPNPAPQHLRLRIRRTSV